MCVLFLIGVRGFVCKVSYTAAKLCVARSRIVCWFRVFNIIQYYNYSVNVRDPNGPERLTDWKSVLSAWGRFWEVFELREYILYK